MTPGIDGLNLPSSSRFSQSFQQFVKDIADARSKGVSAFNKGINFFCKFYLKYCKKKFARQICKK